MPRATGKILGEWDRKKAEVDVTERITPKKGKPLGNETLPARTHKKDKKSEVS